MALLLTTLCLIVLPHVTQSIQPTRLRVEYQEEPRGLDVAVPRFFWTVDSEGVRGSIQAAYQVVIYTTGGTVVVDTGKVSSSAFAHVTIPKFTMMSHSHYKWTVTLYDSANKATSATSYFSAGLLNQPRDWQNASWIGGSTIQIRTEFMIGPTTSGIRHGTCYIAMPGYYVAYLNEQPYLNQQPIDDHALGYFTTFQSRVYYDAVSCTGLLKENDQNVFGIVLGNGWYSQPSVNVGKPMAKILIYIEFMDNSTQSIVSNGNDWYQHAGPIRMNDIYQGEWYDATMETDGWLHPNYDYSSWTKATVITNPVVGVLSSSAIMPVSRKVESYTPVAITEPSPGVFVVDFGQNVAGYCQIRIPGNGKRGTNVTMIHSEELDESGFVVMMYGNSPMIATYTLKGDGNEEVYSPVFTYFGYQYVQISGLPTSLSQNEMTSYFIHTDFDTSSSIEFGPDNINNNGQNGYLLNYVQHMTRYASLSNYINIPTDCPQRERRGWLGDAQLTAETTIYNFDMAASYTKFLRDIRDSQLHNNHKSSNGGMALPDVVPYYHHGSIPGDPSWTNAYINLVHWMYRYYGDTRLITEHYTGMKQQLLYLESQLDTKGLLPLSVNHYGDWCAVSNGDGCAHKSAIISTYDYATQCLYFSEAATIAGNTQDAETYYNKYIAAKQAIYTNYWDSSKGAFIDTQAGNAVPFSTAQSLGLNLDVLNDTTEVTQCVNSFVNDIVTNEKKHLTAGIIGTKFVLRELCRHGHCDTALESVLYRDFPSYGWWFENKATTLWENWQSTQYHADGSKNHIMFGAESNWYYQYLGGIRPGHNDTNWRLIEIDPYTNASLYNILYVDATVNTLRGDISVSWIVNPNGEICGTGDEDQNVVLTCTDSIVSIPFASYGTPSGSCGNYTIDKSCNNNNTLEIIKNLCLNKQTCTIPVSNTEFKYDPCVDIKKHLDVEAVCATPLVETRNVVIPNGANATIRFRQLSSANGNYKPSNEWTINENGKTIFKAGSFVNGDDGVVSGKIIDDDTLEIVVLSGTYSFTRFS